MKKVEKKLITKSGAQKSDPLSKRFDKIETLIEKLAQMMLEGFARADARIDRVEQRMKSVESGMATKSDILDLHDKFIHRREFDELSLRVSKIEDKIRK